MVLSNKVIMIISSEAWGKIYLSKHNYALTLAEFGNKVYFLNPIDFNLTKGEIQVKNSDDCENLFIVTYRPFFPWLLKFHFRWLFDFLIRIQVKKILKHLNIKISIVWDFNCSYLYNDLSIFNADYRIFHPVDKISKDVRKKRADLFLSVSPLILNDYIAPDVPKYLINHGISKNFEVLANQVASTVNYENKKIKVCYIGNLLIPNLNREYFKTIVLNSEEIQFYLIGPFNLKENNIYNELVEGDKDFISFLESCLNVTFKGVLTNELIAQEINEYDAFLVCYKSSEHYRSDNSHKVLEYLCSGKVVISTPMLFYKNLDLIEMEDLKISLPELFKHVMADLPYYNSVKKMEYRKSYAKSNTYRKNVLEIAYLIQINGRLKSPKMAFY